jgi:hypothetical protein
MSDEDLTKTNMLIATGETASTETIAVYNVGKGMAGLKRRQKTLINAEL